MNSDHSLAVRTQFTFVEVFHVYFIFKLVACDQEVLRVAAHAINLYIAAGRWLAMVCGAAKLFIIL